MTRLFITFSAHVCTARRDGMTTGIAAYGMLASDPSCHVSVEVTRPAKLDKLKQQLTAWERHGFLVWRAASSG